jgi:arsenate reductase-like glutaredoxin family protein
MTVRYDEVHLYATPGQAACATMRQWLDSNGVAFTNLDYQDPTETLAALSTWFQDEEGNDINLTDTPVLVYDRVMWEADDKSDRYAHRQHVTDVSNLPDDFLTLVDKVS